MPSPESLPVARFVIAQELRSLLLSPALWLMFILLSLLSGYSFFQAVELFGQASRTALSFPELARGMNPLDGIFIPTFGAYYLSQTLLLPFVAIRLIGLDKQSGALKLLLQLPLSPLKLCSLKLAAMGMVWLVSLVPAFSVLACWLVMGGHVHGPEIAVLLAGHGLYGLTVVCFALLAAVISDSLPTAAMVCLAATLGTWVLNFAETGQGGFAGLLSSLSLNTMLHQLENGLLTPAGIAPFLLLSLLFFLLAAIWLHPGIRLSRKAGQSIAVMIVLGVALAGVTRIPGSMDVTENRCHSLNPADTRALQEINGELTLTIHLNPGDSRLQDMKKDILAKLQRTVPHLTIHYAQDSGEGGLFGAAGEESYGLIEYGYNGLHDQSYSNSSEEILAIIYAMAGVQVTPATIAEYPGYPLVEKDPPGKWWFYLILPLFFAGCAVYCRKGWR